MLKDLEKKLYTSRSSNIREENKDAKKPDMLDLRSPEADEPAKKTSVPESWGKEPQNAQESFIANLFPGIGRYGKWIFWILMAGALLLIGFGGFFLYQYTRGNDMSLTLSAPATILTGVPFEAEASFTNRSDRAAEDAILSIALPENVFSSEDHAKRTITKDLGDIAPGQNIITKIPLVVFGAHDNDTLKRLEARVSYYPPSLGPKVRFEKSAIADIAVREPAIKLDMATPEKVLNGEPFEITVAYANNSVIKFPHVQIELALPNAFKLAKAVPQPTKGTATWAIDNLDAGGKGIITITGTILGEEESFFAIRGIVKTDGKIIDEKSAKITIKPSSLSLALAVNNQPNYVAHPGDTLQYTITYKNNDSDIGFNDVALRVKLNGEMFDFATMNTNGAFSSIDNTIIWNAGTVPDLRLVQPGSQGSVSFSIRTKNTYPIRRLADKNFTLSLDAQITSPTVYDVSTDKTISLGHLVTKVAGSTTLQSQAFYTDPTGQIKNTGPVPPKVNTATTFVINLKLVNYATDAAGVEIEATLAPGVRFTGIVKSNMGSSTPQYDASTSQVRWAIAKIVANKGVVNAPVEAVFQIEATPNVAQAGQVMPLMGETTLTATDTFTSSTITMTAPALTSQIANDPTVNQNQWTVQP